MNYSEDYIYDQRQYCLISQKIKKYLLRELDANSVFIDVDNLIRLLKLVDRYFIIKCQNLLLDIDVNIYYLREGHLGKDFLLKEDKERIDELMKTLLSLVKSKIDNNLTDEDVKYKY